jgi:hypothetical protein
MSVTAAGYAKARAEIIGLFGWDADILAPAQVLRVDCATALRLALDELQGRLVRGEAVDVTKMLTASEALSRLLPAAVLAAPPSERREDPRKVLFDLIMQMRERDGVPSSGLDARDDEIARLQVEIAQLRARLGDAPTLVERVPAASAAHMRAVITPSESDVTPPSELGAFRVGGPPPAPDDPRPCTAIEGKAEPVDADAIDLRAGFNSGPPEPWRQFTTDIEGNPLTARGRRY